MENLKKDDIIELNIEDIGAEGNGIGRYLGELVVFVPGTVPGDNIKAKIRKKKKKFAEAKLLELTVPSPDRVKPECEYFGTCNGCKMQNTDYPKQLEIKRNIVKNAFIKIGGFESINIPGVLGSDDIYFYRNKLEFSFSNDRWLTEEDMNRENIDKSFALGYHIPGFNEKILDINKCYLQSDISNRILILTRDFFKSKGSSIYTTKTHSGYLRFLTIRRSVSSGEVMVNLITYDDQPELINEYAALLQKEIPEVSIFVNSLTQSKAQVALADNFIVITGNGYITENIGGYDFKITPNTFFQTNSKQCEKLFKSACDMAEFTGNENALDLYCGCGAISLYISAKVKSVYGVELSKESIEMANDNALLNKVTNCGFKDMDVKDYLGMLTSPPSPLLKGEGGKAFEIFEIGKNKNLTSPPSPLLRGEGSKNSEFSGEGEKVTLTSPPSILLNGDDEKKFDVIILDPPRSGIHPKAAEYLLQYEAKRIIYVSCNPATQARDIALLKDKYDITSIQPVDMFPHTFHIENVVRLDLR